MNYEKEKTTCPRNKHLVTITHYFRMVNDSKVDISHYCPLASVINCDGTEDGINKCNLMINC